MNNIYRKAWIRTRQQWSAGKPNRIAGVTLIALSAGLAVENSASANTINTSTSCAGSPGASVGNEAAKGANAGQASGSGTYTLVAGCDANGNNQLGVTAYGAFSNATGQGAVALGFNAVSAKWSTAVGLDSNAANGGIALGFSAVANGLNSVSIGSAGGNGTSALSVANSTTASGPGAVAIGSNATKGAQAKAADSIALGGQASVDDTSAQSIAQGKGSTITYAQNALALGNGAQVDGASGNGNSADGAIAIGNSASIASGAASAVALGDGANAKNAKGVALGSGAIAKIAGDVALGAGSATDAAVGTPSTVIAGKTYNFAGINPASTVSVGTSGNERTVTHVAAGQVNANSTDAINGSQLYATNQAVESVNGAVNKGWTLQANGDTPTTVKPGDAVQFKDGKNIKVARSGQDVTVATADDLVANSFTAGNSVLSTTGLTVNNGVNNASYGATGMTIVNGPSVTTAGINAGSLKVTSVAAGLLAASSTDAVNGSQLYALGNSSAAVLGGNAAYNTATGQVSISNVGGTGKNNVNDAIAAINTTAGKGWTLSASGGQGTNVAPGTSVDLKNSDGNVVVNKTSNDNNVTFDLAKNLKLDSVALGGTLINGVGLRVGNDVSLGATGLVINNGPSVKNTGIDAGAMKITRVAAGSADTDAVNVGQLNTAIAGAKTRYYGVNDGGTRGGNDNGGGATGKNAVAAGVDTTASGDGATAIGSGSSASGKGATAIGRNANAGADGSVALGDGASDGGRGAENYTGKYSGAANASVGTVSVGNAATGATRTISNVADARQATDAVNLRQLDGAVKSANDYTDDKVRQINVQTTQNSTDIQNLQGGKDGFFQVNNTDVKAKPSVTGVNAAAGGAGAMASGTGSLAVGTDAKATANNAVAIGNGSVADRANTVAVGAAGSERQVTHVAAGTVGTDAVNVNQLKASEQGAVRYGSNGDGSVNYKQVTLGNGPGQTTVSNVAPGVAGTDAVNVNQLNQGVAGANRYTDAAIGRLRRDMNGGVAAAIAMANLPQPYAPGRGMTAVGLGSYQGQTAIAVGASAITDNGRWVLKLGGTTNTRGQTGVGVGAGYQW